MEKFDIGNHLLPSLNKEKTKRLFEDYHYGNQDARNQLILRNLRFVYYLVHQNFSKNVRSDEFEDLISIGTIGLIKAIETFEVSKKVEFATYSKRVIFNEILMYLKKRKKWNQLKSLQDVILYNDDGLDLLLEDTIADPNYFLDYILDEYEKQEIINLFSILTEQEQEVLHLYFGFHGTKMSQLEISKKVGVSQSYISRIIKNAIKKIQKRLLDQENSPRKKSQP